jgi:putative NIF3 family GTP cyclohydrolase 1 type 2
MTLGEFYRKAIEVGIEHDPRGAQHVYAELERKKRDYEKLTPDKKEYYDFGTLQNPYPDSRILVGNGEEKVHGILVGIDIDIGEILLADHLKSRGKGIDLLLSHHPSGRAYADLYEVMHMQSDILSLFGVPVNIAEGCMDKRIKEVERKLMPVNHTRAVDAARLVGVPLLCLHTPADNMVTHYLQRRFDEDPPYQVGDVVAMLREIPEYKAARLEGVGPKIILGSKKRKAGKIFVDMTGGTEGAKEIIKSITHTGVSTIVGMHMSEEHRKEAQKHHLNVVVAGHISSDNLGINLLLDELSKESQFEIHACSGFRRFSRNSRNN